MSYKRRGSLKAARQREFARFYSSKEQQDIRLQLKANGLSRVKCMGKARREGRTKELDEFQPGWSDSISYEPPPFFTFFVNRPILLCLAINKQTGRTLWALPEMETGGNSFRGGRTILVIRRQGKEGTIREEGGLGLRIGAN